MGFAARRYKELTANSGEIERRQIELIERIRLDTQAVRNWGEADQITRISLPFSESSMVNSRICLE